MRFGMSGSKSNGEGLFDFYTYDLRLMSKLSNYPDRYNFMHMLINQHLFKCHTENTTKCKMLVSYIGWGYCFGRDKEEFIKSLNYLKRIGAIKCKKVKDAFDLMWEIELI